VALPTFAAAAPAMQQLIDISYRPGPQQQTHHMLLQQANGTDSRTDGQTNSRTDTVPLHRPSLTSSLVVFLPLGVLDNKTL